MQNNRSPFSVAEWDIIGVRCPTLATVRAGTPIADVDRETLIREQMSVQDAAMEKGWTGGIRFWANRPRV